MGQNSRVAQFTGNGNGPCKFQEGVMYNKQQHKVVILFVKNSGPARK